MEHIYEGPEHINPPYPNISSGNFLYDKIKSFRNNNALICSLTGRKVSYAELLDQSLRTAAVFRDLGIHEGDAVSVISENSIEYSPVVLGILFLGATVAPINPLYVERELEHCFLLSRPRLVVSSAQVAPRVVPVVAQLVSAGKLPAGARSLVMGAASGAAQSLQQLASAVKSTQGLPVVVENAADKTSFIMCSSGTTGLPKGVELTNKNALTYHLVFSDPRSFDFNQTDVMLGVLPFFHQYGLALSLIAFSFGMQLVPLPKFEDKLFLSTIQKYKVTIALLVPPLIVFLGKHPLVPQYDLSSLREIWCSAAPLSREAQEAATNRLDGKDIIRQAYGLTETSLAVVVNPIHRNKFGSSGVLVAGMKCKLVDPETGKTVGREQRGELCFKGDLIMKGYKDNPKGTREMIDGEGWLHTGDIGFFDEDGYLFIVDRIKELIKYKGYQVAPAELEALLLTHPGIQDAAVIGLPDERAGELPLAFVILQPGAKLTEKQVIDFVAGQVSAVKRLHGGVRFVDTIPKTASGKILRRELRKMIAMKSKI